MSELLDAARYLWFPLAAALASGALALVWSPTPYARSYVQHLAAGVVLAAVLVEVFPEVLAQGDRVLVGIGFALGTGLMLLLKWWAERYERQDGGLSLGLVATAFIDTFVDGLTIGIGFALTEEAGAALSIALAVELFFLGLAVVSPGDGGQVSVGRAISLTGGLALVLAVGSAIGIVALGGLGHRWIASLLAFGTAALLYLVLEELLVEAHEHTDPVPASGLLFAGVLVFLVTVGF